jgi:SHS2 domain-containing protein
VTRGRAPGPSRGRRVLAHTADVGLEAHGPDLASVFEEAGLALAELTADRPPAARDPGVDDRGRPTRPERPVHLASRDLVALAFAWLNELVATVDVEGALASVVVTDVLEGAEGRWELFASIGTEPFDVKRVRRRADVKSATYHGLAVEPEPGGGWSLTAYLDV